MDLRLMGRGVGGESLDTLAVDKRRMLLCSRDVLRDAALISATTADANTKYVSAGFPASNLVDGNRLTFMDTSPNCDYVDVIFDTGGGLRKSMLQVEYGEGLEIDPVAVSFTNDVAANFASVSIANVYRGARSSLWQLPFDAAVGTTYTYPISVWGGDDATYISNGVPGGGVNLTQGFYAVPQSGRYAGVPRRIVTQAGTTLGVDAPWPERLDAGTSILYKRFAESFLGNVFVKVRLQRRFNPTVGPIRCCGLSMFDWYYQLTGDKGAFRQVRAPNPTRLNRTAEPAGIVHALLNGRKRFESSVVGPKSVWQIGWGAAPSRFFEDVLLWGAAGEVGLVDEEGRYSMGYAAALSSERLPKAIGTGEESSVSFQWYEI